MRATGRHPSRRGGLRFPVSRPIRPPSRHRLALVSRTALLALVVLTLAGLAGALLLLGSDGEPGHADPLRAEASSRAERSMPLPEAEADRRTLPQALGAAEAAPGRSLHASGVAPAGIEGRVVDRAGSPRPAAQVSVWRAVESGFAGLFEPTGALVLTDGQGRFELHAVPIGVNLALEAVDDDSAPSRVPVRALHPGELRPVGDIVLGPGTTLVGRVLDQDGAPLEGATVSVREGVDDGPALRSSTSDADGRYAVPHLAPRQYGIQAACPGYATMESVQAFVLGPSGPEWIVDFTLPRADRTMQGTVVDSMGGPLPDVGLRLLRRVTAGGAHFLADTRSDADGRFLIEGLPDGSFDVSVDSPDWYLDHTLQLEADSGQLIRLHPSATVLGELVTSGAPPERFTITVKPDGRTGARTLGGDLRRVFSPEAGEARFEWTGLRPGSYAFLVEAPGFAATRSQDVIIGQGQAEARLLVPLQRGGTLLGRVDPPLAGVKVEVREVDWDPASPLEDAFPTPPLPGLGARTDDDGRFRIEHVPEGYFVVSLRPDGLPAAHVREVQVDEGGSRDLGTIALKAGGMVTGLVTGPDGRPRAGASVRLSGDDVHLAVVTDADGSFRLDAVPAGHYEATVTPGSLSEALTLEARAQLSVAVGEETRLEFQLSERPRRLR